MIVLNMKKHPERWELFIESVYYGAIPIAIVNVLLISILGEKD
jgi:hypothetical protein